MDYWNVRIFRRSVYGDIIWRCVGSGCCSQNFVIHIVCALLLASYSLTGICKILTFFVETIDLRTTDPRLTCVLRRHWLRHECKTYESERTVTGNVVSQQEWILVSCQLQFMYVVRFSFLMVSYVLQLTNSETLNTVRDFDPYVRQTKLVPVLFRRCSLLSTCKTAA